MRASELGDLLIRSRTEVEGGDGLPHGSLTAVVSGHGDVTHADTIETTVRELLATGGELDVAVVNATGGYVQVIARPAELALYGEAVDPEAHGSGPPLDAGQRALLGELGWRDPKLGEADFATRNLTQTWELSDRVTVRSVAETLTGTLEAVYSVPSDEDLAVQLVYYGGRLLDDSD